MPDADHGEEHPVDDRHAAPAAGAEELQAKYKGPENRELLNQEMMKLYKENGTSPFGACLPPLLQMPFLIVLYSLIRDLSKTTATN